MNTIFIKAPDLMILENRPTKKAAQDAYRKMRLRMGKAPHEWITIEDYATFRGCTVQIITNKLSEKV